MKILAGTQIKEVDSYTIETEPISSVDLMERASVAFVEKVAERWSPGTPVKIFAGPGNNGGDALAVARLLSLKGYNVEVFLFNPSSNLSPDCEVNKQRLDACRNVRLTEVVSTFTPPQLNESDLVIDGLFGTGVSRPLNGGYASVVKYINASAATVVSIDVPSGLMCEDNTYNVMNHIVKADYTFTFQYPKLAFFFADTSLYVGKWEVLDIGLVEPKGERMSTPYCLTEVSHIAPMLKVRPKFAHKGTMGHAALVAGKAGMAGAAVLSARACMRSGAGKLTVHTPSANAVVLQIAVPEAILSVEAHSDCFSRPFDANNFDALAIGPGIGTDAETAQAFIEQIRFTRSPIIVDADGINILGSHRGWIQQLPKNTILTPHKKELFGLVSTTHNFYEELEATRELASKQNIYIVIKGAYSAVVTPEGKVWFNPTGNPGMATAGSGDVLTGIILALLAQDYSHEEAVLLGVYLHGLAGDIAAAKFGEDSLIASDIIDCLPEAFKELSKANIIRHN